MQLEEFKEMRITDDFGDCVKQDCMNNYLANQLDDFAMPELPLRLSRFQNMKG